MLGPLHIFSLLFSWNTDVMWKGIIFFVIALHYHEDVSQNETDLGFTEDSDKIISSFTHRMSTHGNVFARKATSTRCHASLHIKLPMPINMFMLRRKDV